MGPVWALLMTGLGLPTPDPRLSRMAELYQATCLAAFPDDAAVDRLMAARGARPLTPDQAKVTLRDDPAGAGRWTTPDAQWW